jgi:hypothetical protein
LEAYGAFSRRGRLDYSFEEAAISFEYCGGIMEAYGGFSMEIGKVPFSALFMASVRPRMRVTGDPCANKSQIMRVPASHMFYCLI